ncbi:MAG: hypothetical protein KBC33_01295 [Candidatus Pacebacteria bacterium]|nr:hypothetical protein [Candidatus Paceibacterota bacterium]
MPRRVQDIVPNNHRSIRDIPVERNDIQAPVEPPRKRTSGKPITVRKPEMEMRREVREEDTADEAPEPVKRVSVTPPSRKKRSSGSKKFILMLMGIVVIVAGAGYVASVYFSRAAFSIVPKSIPITVNGAYTAQPAGTKSTLTYELAVVKGSANVSVPATDGPSISTSAKGRITVYNKYIATAQRLIAGTRFADSTGRIYKLTDSISVPGYTTSGGTIVPGSITASVVADQPGESYNLTKNEATADLTIVAYKGTPRYETVYGRVSTDIIGGFVGTKKTVSPSALASTTEELKAKIVASLSEQIRNTLPEGYVMYPNAYVPVFSAATVGTGDPKSATVTLQGTLYGILFKKSELVARVAGEEAISMFDGFAFDTPGFESLDFSIANLKDFSPEKKNTLIIKLKGDAHLVGSIPVEELKKKLAGLSLADTSSVLRQYKPVIEIDKSSGEITPPWSKVPSNPERIRVEVQPTSGTQTE